MQEIFAKAKGLGEFVSHIKINQLNYNDHPKHH